MLVTTVIIFFTFLPSARCAAPAGQWWNDYYGARQKITVTAGSSNVPGGYSVSVSENTATLISSGYLRADGNDWRVVYWDGSVWVELDRWVDDIVGDGWNSSNTVTWFKTQSGITALSSDDNYYIYYGNADETQTAPASMSDSMGTDSASAVFWYADDFDEHSANTDPDGWTDQGSEDFKVALHGSEKWFQAQTSSDWRDGSTATGMPNIGDAVLSAKVYYHQFGTNAWGGIGVHIGNGGVGRIVVIRDGGWHHADEPFSGSWIADSNIHFPLGTKGRIELVASGTSLDAYWYNPAGYSPERVTLFTGYTMLPGAGKLAVYSERPWTTPGNNRWVDIDDVIVRQHVASEPSLVLAARELIPDTCPVVTNTGDSGPGPVSAWPGSLRACIDYANLNPGTTITFDIPDTAPGYTTSGSESWWRITPGSGLPGITASNIVIDGSSQASNYGSDTNSLGPEIEVDGTGAGATDGIVFSGGGGMVMGLAVNRFGDDGIVLSTLDGNTVQDCYIGIDPTGTLDRGNADHGIIVRDGSDNNTIGGPGAGNVISGNSDRGIRLLGTTGNTIQGNLIGTDPTGTVDLGNGAWGIHLEGASGNTIGGTGAGESNVIAFNSQDGLYITGFGADSNLISGNAFFSNGGLGIDLSPNGVGAGPNANNGKTAPVFTSLANSGSDLAVTVISGPGDIIEFYRANNTGIPVVGEDPTGSGEGYLHLGACTDNGVCSGPYMVSGVDGNGGNGTINVTLSGTVLSSTDILTATATDTSNNTSEFAANNVVVSPCPTVVFTGDTGLGTFRDCLDYANANPGTTIDFDIPETDPNYIISGADSWWRISPVNSLPIIGAPGTVIDGLTQTTNRGDTNSRGPEIEVDGTNAGNNQDGLASLADSVVIRGLVINRFDSDGVYLNTGSGCVVQDCYIGLDPTGTSVLPNGDSGISLGGGSSNNTIGGVGTGNVISGNGASGITARGSGNVIRGNYIGTDPAGTASHGNTDHGIIISGGAGNTVGGTVAGEGNVIGFNGLDGLFLTGGGAIQNLLSGNSIFSNGELGIDLSPNGVGAGPSVNSGKEAPTFSSVAGTGANFDVTLTTEPGDILEFFRVGNTAVPAVDADPTGYGEGYLYLGSCTNNGTCSGPYMISSTDGDAGAGTVRATLSSGGLLEGDTLTATATDTLDNTSEFSVNVILYPTLDLVKQAILSADGSLITNASTIPRGTEFQFLIYVENAGDARSDVSIQDVLNPAFAYSSGSIKVDNSVSTGSTVGAIYASVSGTAPLTDAIDADVASISGNTINVGNRYVANGQLDIAANRVWALLFTVRMQ